jgi:hypothetical protein
MPETDGIRRPSSSSSSSSRRSSSSSSSRSRSSSPGGGRGGAGSFGRTVRRFAPSSRSYAAAEAVTLTAIVAYDVAGRSEPKLPRPAPIVGVLGFYGLLAAVGSVASSWQPLTVMVGWLVTLTVLVTGKRGAGITRLVGDFTKYVTKLGGASSSASGGG